MTTKVWEFENSTDWKLADGQYTHRLGPTVKDVTLNFRLYLADLAREALKPAEGDYVLRGQQWNGGHMTPVIGTAFVNGHPVSTFLGGERQVVITDLLKKGENTIKFVSERVPNVVTDNDIKFWVSGPAEYDVVRGRFELRPVTQFEAMYGWKRDRKTGQLVNQAKPGEDTIEREIRITLDREPGKK